MNLRDLEYLVAVADRRSFRQAAAACAVSQPTLSTQVKKLEGELDVALVDRSVAPPALTPVGRQVVDRARAILDEVSLIRTLAADATGADTPLRLGAFPTLGPYLLPRVLGGVRERFPRLQLLLTEEKSVNLLALLDAGRLDAALVALPVPDARLRVRPLFREELLLAVPAGHPLDAPGPVAASEVARHELMLLSAGHCLGDQVAAWVREHGASTREDYRASTLETLRAMVAGGGVTLLPALAASASGEARVVVRRIAPPAPTRDIALVWPRTSPRAEVLEALADALVPDAPGAVTHL